MASKLLLAITSVIICLTANAEKVGELKAWVHPDLLDSKSMRFALSQGNSYEKKAETDYGLYAQVPGSQYAISKMLDRKLTKDINEFSLSFTVLQEEGQRHGNAQVSLIGNQNHLTQDQKQERNLSESMFLQNLYNYESPRVLRFGTYYNLEEMKAYFQIEFMSAADNKKHVLEQFIFAPIDDREHTFTLNWNSAEDSYQIIQDGVVLNNDKQGMISLDFSGFQSQTEEKLSNPQIEKLLKKLEEIPEYIQDSSAEGQAEKPNPEFLKKNAEILKLQNDLEAKQRKEQESRKNREAGKLSEDVVALGIQLETESKGILFTNINLNF